MCGIGDNVGGCNTRIKIHHQCYGELLFLKKLKLFLNPSFPPSPPDLELKSSYQTDRRPTTYSVGGILQNVSFQSLHKHQVVEDYDGIISFPDQNTLESLERSKSYICDI